MFTSSKFWLLVLICGGLFFGYTKLKNDPGTNALIHKLIAMLEAFRAAPLPAPSVPTTTPAAGSSFDANCLVYIKTDNGSGSGFIAQVDGQTYVYTNAHAICGTPKDFATEIVSIKTSSGRNIPIPVEIEFSNSFDPNSSNGLEDVARFPLTLDEGESSHALADNHFAFNLDQKVTAYGKSLGGDTINTLEGVVQGLGSDRVEIRCEIVPGNSGGPVVLTGTNQVFGILTYLDTGPMDIWTRGNGFENVTCFAVCPYKVTLWRKIQYTTLRSSLAALKAFDRDTLSLAAACHLEPKSNRDGFEAPSPDHLIGDYSIRQVIVDGGKYALGAAISKGISGVNQRLGGSKAKRAIAYAAPVFADFFARIAQTSASQMTMLTNADTVPYLKLVIPKLLETRKKIHDEFVNEGATHYFQ